MSKSLTPEDRRRLAEKLEVNPATLYQAITGKGAGFSPAKCVEIEQATDGELRRWDLRPGDWHLIWPELIKAKGAPAIPAAGTSKAAHPVARATLRLKRTNHDSHSPTDRPAARRER